MIVRGDGLFGPHGLRSKKEAAVKHAIVIHTKVVNVITSKGRKEVRRAGQPGPFL